MAIKHLGQYMAEKQETHEFRIKIAKEPTDEQIDKMEIHLRKYEAFDITNVKKTIIQPNPADFRSIKAAEVYYIDFKTHMPVSSYMLVNELVQKMGIHERFMVVRNKKEPLHDINNQEEEKDNDDYVTKLTDEDYSEAEKIDTSDYFGEEFKTKFLKELVKTGYDNTEEYKDESK